MYCICVLLYVCLIHLSLWISGSTDIISCSVHGVRHPITAALHIILGMDGQPERHKDIQTDRQTDRQTETQFTPGINMRLGQSDMYPILSKRIKKVQTQY